MIVVRFLGGLGNQLFQYAMMRSLMINNNEDAICDIRPLYSGMRRFELSDAFDNAIINIASDEQLRAIDDRINSRTFLKKALSHVLPAKNVFLHEKETFEYDNRYLKFKDGLLEGYWQNEKYFDNIRDILLNELVFKNKSVASDIEQTILEDKNSVSLHVRRTDYIEASKAYGGICTMKYYSDAVKNMEQKCGKCNFYVFSDDIEWCRENLKDRDYIFVSNENTPNWFDMYLMSICRNNIIANSSFSWWGAWLNKNDEKIVIQPSQWDKLHPKLGIRCEHWVSIKG